MPRTSDFLLDGRSFARHYLSGTRCECCAEQPPGASGCCAGLRGLPAGRPSQWDVPGALEAGVGPGGGTGSGAALKLFRCLRMRCPRTGCGALVDFRAACAQARAAGRASLEPGDGCAAPLCSANFRAANHVKVQLRAAELLRADAALLLVWPTDSLAGRAVYGRAAARAAADAAEEVARARESARAKRKRGSQ